MKQIKPKGVKHTCRYGNSEASFRYGSVNKSIIDLYITTHERKEHINMLSCSRSAKNTISCGLQTWNKNQWTFW